MLDIDDLLAPVRAKLPTHKHVLPLKRALEIEFTLPAKANSRWLNWQAAKSLRGEGEEDRASLVQRAHADVPLFVEALIVGWALQQEDGSFAAVEYTPELGADLLHKLIDSEQGLAVFEELWLAIYTAGAEQRAKSIDPTVTSGNSSGG
jgi:hypothetical protein